MPHLHCLPGDSVPTVPAPIQSRACPVQLPPREACATPGGGSCWLCRPLEAAPQDLLDGSPPARLQCPPPDIMRDLHGSAGKESACNMGDLGWEDPLEKHMATHSSILAWRIPWTRPSDFHLPLHVTVSRKSSVEHPLGPVEDRRLGPPGPPRQGFQQSPWGGPCLPALFLASEAENGRPKLPQDT